jgi:hypothetical protein
MSGTSRQFVLRARDRLGLAAAVAVLVTTTAMTIGIVTTRPGDAPAGPSASAAAHPNAAPALAGQGPGTPAGSAASSAAVPLVLTAADHRQCPATSSACADLSRCRGRRSSVTKATRFTAAA